MLEVHLQSVEPHLALPIDRQHAGAAGAWPRAGRLAGPPAGSGTSICPGPSIHTRFAARSRLIFEPVMVKGPPSNRANRPVTVTNVCGELTLVASRRSPQIMIGRSPGRAVCVCRNCTLSSIFSLDTVGCGPPSVTRALEQTTDDLETLHGLRLRRGRCRRRVCSPAGYQGTRGRRQGQANRLCHGQSGVHQVAEGRIACCRRSLARAGVVEPDLQIFHRAEQLRRVDVDVVAGPHAMGRGGAGFSLPAALPAARGKSPAPEAGPCPETPTPRRRSTR